MSFRNYYDSSTYGRSRGDTTRSGTSHSGIDRPTTVTAKYITPNTSFKSSSIPILSRDRSSTRENETPISTIANRYANYNKQNKDEKPITKYVEKKENYKLSVPASTNRSRDVSPVSTPTKYSVTRTSRHLSPDRRSIKNNISLTKGRSRDPSPTDKDKNIPNKTDKSSGYNGLSNYKLYPRSSSYSRPLSRAEIKPEITVNRYAIANRLSSTTNYLKCSSTEKSRTSVSPINHIVPIKAETGKIGSNNSNVTTNHTQENKIDTVEMSDSNIPNGEHSDCNYETETVTIITRHTSPTPPGSSTYVRTRRADMAKIIEKTITRPKRKPQMVDKELQSDRLDDPTRTSRFGSTTRASTSNWSLYTPSVHNYTGYAGRYSTHYGSLRDHNTNSYSERNNFRRSESLDKETPTLNTQFIKEKSEDLDNESGKSEDMKFELGKIEDEKENDNSEIIINVNLKLKKASAPSMTEMVSPEITITNSQLPPQAPKTDGVVKTKKIKIKKSSTDSLSDSSKKKVIKRRSKSMSSTESDQGSDTNSNDKVKEGLQKNSSSKHKNISPKLKHSKKSQNSRESNSPESSSTLSTQSSISEEDNITQPKTDDTSRTSADQSSIPIDRSAKQTSPLRNESGSEEAKSFLIRALAPVTNLFKNKNQDSESNKCLGTTASESTSKDISNLITESERSTKSKNNTENIIASNDENIVKLKAIRHIESGERAWWLNSDSSRKENLSNVENSESSLEKNMARKIRRIESGERAWWMESNGDINKENQNSKASDSSSFIKTSKKCKHTNVDSDEKPWWLDSNANIPEGIERLTPPRKTSTDSDKSDKFDFYKVRRIESGEKDWWLTSESTSNNIKDGKSNCLSKSGSDQRSFPMRQIRHVESGERPWWLSSSKNIPEGIEKLPTPPPQDDSDSSESEELQIYVPSAQTIPPFPLSLPDDEPLGDRKSPEGLETPRKEEDYTGRISPYENARQHRKNSNLGYHRPSEKFISRYTDIDDILGTSAHIYSPFMDSILTRRSRHMLYVDSECEEIDPTQVRIHDSTAQRPVIKKLRGRNETADYCEAHELDDAALQVFKDGDYGPYLDLDSTLGEQEEDLEGLQDNRKNAIILRTQLSVRVHAIIERLQQSQGRELRRALFTLKQILQSDKDLVHEFIANKGLDCLMTVANRGDQNFLDYILRALGQILLYVDGMHGVMAHPKCVQWLYSLIASNFRHIIKTALKLLLVFVEYTGENSSLLIDAIQTEDCAKGNKPWHNVMHILQDFETSDAELLIYATTLINRCLNHLPDKDKYYDQIDALLDQGIDETIKTYMSKPSTDLDLLRQLQIFEAVLLFEDGDKDEKSCNFTHLDESTLNFVRRRNSNFTKSEQRKSKRFQLKDNEKINGKKTVNDEITPIIDNNSLLKHENSDVIINNEKESKDLHTTMRKRRDRFARQAHIMLQRQEMLNRTSDLVKSDLIISLNDSTENKNNNKKCTEPRLNVIKDEKAIKIVKSIKVPEIVINGNQKYTTGLKQRIQNGTLGHSVSSLDKIAVIKPKYLENESDFKTDKNIILNKEHCVKDLANKLNIPVSPSAEKPSPMLEEMAGIISKAKNDLSKSHSKDIPKSPTQEILPKARDIQLSENDIHWEELKKECVKKEFRLCDLDFSDLQQDSDEDIGQPSLMNGGIPPPPPPAFFPSAGAPPPPPATLPFSKSVNSMPSYKKNLSSEKSNDSNSSLKNKKTIKLFWREVQDNPLPSALRDKINGFIWDELPNVELDTKMLEHLFESKSNDLVIKKIVEQKRHVFLDAKRSNAINIAMKKLPTPQCIKNAILKMDATAIGREGIEKLFSLLPTEEEKEKINDIQSSSPGLPLGSAEQFLMTLSSISEVNSRLKLWVFKLDFDNLEKEIAEPLMDLKQGIQILKTNSTFKIILSTLRSVGSFLNGSQVKGFRLEYLSKVVEVKDTVHKHPLLYHICDMIIEKFPNSSDLFSELGPVIRASKVDFDMLNANLLKLESDCKASWDHLKKIVKHDNSQIFKTKIPDFLTDAAQRTIMLSIIKKKVIARYNKFLLYVGVPPTDLEKCKPSEFLKSIAEFSLEYRTARERTLNQLEKKANHRERNKTRGKLIIDVGNYSSKNAEKSADNALTELLKTNSDISGTMEGRKKTKPLRRFLINDDESGDDEIIETLVRGSTAAASTKRRTGPRERRNRISDRMSFNRTLDGNQSWTGQEAVGLNSISSMK